MTKTMKNNLNTLRTEKKENLRKISMLEKQNKRLYQNLSECNKSVEVLEEYIIHNYKKV